MDKAEACVLSSIIVMICQLWDPDAYTASVETLRDENKQQPYKAES